MNAWLSLLTAGDTESLAKLISDYPWMEAICRDISEYLYHPEEVLTMFSDALRILDQNTAMYMVDEMKKQIEEDRQVIAEKDEALAKKDEALAEKDEALAENQKAVEELRRAIEKEREEIARLRAELELSSQT